MAAGDCAGDGLTHHQRHGAPCVTAAQLRTHADHAGDERRRVAVPGGSERLRLAGRRGQAATRGHRGGAAAVRHGSATCVPRRRRRPTASGRGAAPRRRARPRGGRCSRRRRPCRPPPASAPPGWARTTETLWGARRRWACPAEPRRSRGRSWRRASRAMPGTARPRTARPPPRAAGGRTTSSLPPRDP